ncbi:MAG: hypothetical protein Fur0012_13420 [Elusimicrobiota bacterium]
MDKKKKILISAAIFALSLLSSSVGIKWGTPSRARTELVFKNNANLRDIMPALKESRNEVYSSYGAQRGSELLKLYLPSDGFMEVIWDGKKIKTEKEKLHAMRSVLLQNRFPDEQKTLYALSRIKPGEFKFDPGIYQYGGLYFYFCGIALKICSIAGFCRLSSDSGFYMANPQEASMLYTAVKMTGAVAGALFSSLLFLLGLEFFSFRAGLFAALFSCFLPSISFEAHSFKPFSFFLPFWLASAYFALKSFKESSRFSLFYFLSGVFSGLCAGSMLFGVFSSFSFLAAWLMRPVESGKIRFSVFFYAPAGFLLAFFCVNPYYIISFRDAFNELTHVGGVHGFHASLKHMLHYSFFEAHKILSWPVLLLGLFGFLCGAILKDRRILILAAPLPFFYFYTANAHWDFPHYSMPLVAIFLPLASIAAVKLSERFRIFYLVIFVSLVWNIGNLFYYKKVFADNEKNLLKAGEWISKNIPKGSSIGTSVYPYFGFKSYPPFPIMDYSLKPKADASYYIINDINHVYRSMNLSYRDTRAEDKDMVSKYDLMAVFKREKTWLDRLYSNYLYALFEQEIRVYRKKKLSLP